MSIDEETDVSMLLDIANDWNLLINKLPNNCRNISDEVFPGIHVGDKIKIIMACHGYTGEESFWVTVALLKKILESPIDDKVYHPPLYDDSNRFVNMTEVFPKLFIGNEGAAKNAFYLKKIGVSHVLNTAEGTISGLVDTNQKFYKPFGINYKGLKLQDVAQTNISMYFLEVAEYIDEALSSGGKVLVNCLMGMSRSSTCVLAYLMLKKNMTAVEALMAVRKHRDVRPNDGFLRQLADLDNKLRRERGLLKA